MQPGHRIEHYVLIEQIGQGGQAVVWSAEDERLNRTVAIKTILPKSELNEMASTEGDGGDSTQNIPVQRFRREAQIIAELEHPSILPIYTFGQDGDQIYIVMRYMAGGSLKKVLQHQPLELARVLELARPLADALDLAHQRNIIHRDIKSANILLDARQHPYLADFGLSVTVGDATGEGGTGTLAYMSPEQLAGEPFDHRSDIYAFGILLYEMLTGAPPLVGQQTWNVQQMLTGEPLPAPDGAPDAVVDALRRATADQPQDRFNSASELIEALSRTLTTNEPAKEPEIPVLLPITDPAMLALLKANDMFHTALEDWADGAGRFRFYADDFQYVDSFYRSEDWGVLLDEAATRLMFRAALEHGYNLKTWTARLSELAERRAVALQTLTSDLAPSRLRAIELLTTVPDAEPPAIPIRVATIISRDSEAVVRRAGIRLLEVRAAPSANWRQVAYNPEIDDVLAHLAVDDTDRAVRHAAARASARLRSEYAISKIGEWASAGNANAFAALVEARDEVPALPPTVPADIRRRVFAKLTVRQLLERWWWLLVRFAGGLLGFGLGWATIQFVQYIGGELLGLQAVGNALASGALYGAAMAVGILASVEPAHRLRAWSRAGRIVLAWLLGTLLVSVAFVAIRRFYYFNEEPLDVIWLLIPAALFAGGFAIASGLTQRAWIRSAAGAAGALIGTYFSWLAYAAEITPDPVIYFTVGKDSQNLTLAIWLAITVGLLTFLPEGLRWLWQRSQSATDA